MRGIREGKNRVWEEENVRSLRYRPKNANPNSPLQHTPTDASPPTDGSQIALPDWHAPYTYFCLWWTFGAVIWYRFPDKFLWWAIITVLISLSVPPRYPLYSLIFFIVAYTLAAHLKIL